MRRQLLGGTFNPAALFGKYAAAGLYIPDFNPSRAAPSGLGRLWQLPTAQTAVAVVADPIGTALGEDQGAALGSDVVPAGDGDGSSIANWTTNGAGATLTLDSGTFKVENAGAATGAAGLIVTSVVGAVYQISVDVVQVSGASTCGVFPVGGTATFLGGGTSASIGSAGTAKIIYVVAVSTGLNVRFGPNSATAGHFVRLDNLSIRRVLGAHAGMITAGSRGTLRAGNAASRYVWRGDGSDDNLLTTLAPAAAFTMMSGVEFDAVSDKCIGASVGANLISLGTDANGLATAYVGSTVVALSAADVRDIPGVIAISVSGSSYYGFWKPFTGAAEIASGSFSGSIPTTQPLRIGAENDDGTAVAFHAGDNYYDFAIQAQLTPAEMLAVAGYASRPLA